jgi:hypothetical protein
LTGRAMEAGNRIWGCRRRHRSATAPGRRVYLLRAALRSRHGAENLEPHPLTDREEHSSPQAGQEPTQRPWLTLPARGMHDGQREILLDLLDAGCSL